MKLGQTGETSSWFATHPRLIDRINRLRQLRGLTPVETPAEELASSGQ
jgi:Zn-dependent protease with chaperone function